MKKMTAILMAILFSLSMISTVFAGEVASNKNGANAITNETTYESVWLDSSSSGSFPIYTPNSGTIGVTLKVESSSDDSFAYISVKKPDGTYFKNRVTINRNTNNGEGGVYRMYLAPSGTYTIEYQGYTTVGMRIMCWMY